MSTPLGIGEINFLLLLQGVLHKIICLFLCRPWAKGQPRNVNDEDCMNLYFLNGTLGINDYECNGMPDSLGAMCVMKRIPTSKEKSSMPKCENGWTLAEGNNSYRSEQPSHWHPQGFITRIFQPNIELQYALCILFGGEKSKHALRSRSSALTLFEYLLNQI